MNQIEEFPLATLVQDDRPSTYPSSRNDVFAPAAPLPADYVFGPQTTILKQGSVFPPAAKPLPCDIHWDRDVPVKLRDGVTIYTDVLRPVDGGKVPVIVTWSPYGKAFRRRMSSLAWTLKKSQA